MSLKLPVRSKLCVRSKFFLAYLFVGHEFSQEKVLKKPRSYRDYRKKWWTSLAPMKWSQNLLCLYYWALKWDSFALVARWTALSQEKAEIQNKHFLETRVAREQADFILTADQTMVLFIYSQAWCMHVQSNQISQAIVEWRWWGQPLFCCMHQPWKTAFVEENGLLFISVSLPKMNSAFLPKTYTRPKSCSHKGALSGCLCLEHRFYLSKLRMKLGAMLILNMQNMLLLWKQGQWKWWS